VRVAFEIHSGRRVVSHQQASTTQEALIEYLRALGCRDDEITRIGTAAVAWRGAVYSATPEQAHLAR
jgi:hypothetical protein